MTDISVKCEECGEKFMHGMTLEAVDWIRKHLEVCENHTCDIVKHNVYTKAAVPTHVAYHCYDCGVTERMEKYEFDKVEITLNIL